MDQPDLKILVTGPAWIGDMVMAQVLFKLLHQHTSNLELHVLAPEWTLPLLQRMPEIAKAIPMPVKHGVLGLGLRKKIGQQLRAAHYDQAILLPNSFKSALISWWARIPVRTGWRGEMRYGLLNDLRILDKKRYPLMIERFAALGLPAGTLLPKPLPQPALEVDASQVEMALQALALNNHRPILALCPGAEYGPAKRWPVTHFTHVAKHFIHQGWQIWIFGSDKDTATGHQIQEGLENEIREHCFCLTGKTSLAQAIDLLSLANAVVSNDSGLMHVSAALNVPLVALYGSSTPEFTPPLGLPDKTRMLSLNLACSPCFKRECPLGHLDCLKDLHPDLVKKSIMDITQGM